jgi:hypothetical protein
MTIVYDEKTERLCCDKCNKPIEKEDLITFLDGEGERWNYHRDCYGGD